MENCISCAHCARKSRSDVGQSSCLRVTCSRSELCREVCGKLQRAESIERAVLAFADIVKQIAQNLELEQGSVHEHELRGFLDLSARLRMLQPRSCRIWCMLLCYYTFTYFRRTSSCSHVAHQEPVSFLEWSLMEWIEFQLHLDCIGR